MESAQGTINDIVSISQRLINALTVHLGRQNSETVELSGIQLAGDLHKIVATSLAILETLKKSLNYRDRTLDERLTDWLLSQEPTTCMDILNTMAKLLRVEEEKSLWKWLPMTPFGPSEGKVKWTISLFTDHRDRFHFLLTTDVWNHEIYMQGASVQADNIDSRASAVATSARIDSQHMEEVPMSIDATMHAVARNTSEKRKEVDRKQLEDILQWLDGLDCTEKHEVTVDLRQSGTCVWLFDTYAYKTWRHGDNLFLWLHGKPGAGKSVLTASIIEALGCSLEDGEVLTFFYCDFRNERSTDAAQVMRSLLSQLLYKFPDGLIDPGNVVDDLVKERGRSKSILNSPKRLARFVASAAERFPQLPFIVIDALDECRDIQDLLGALVVLSQAKLRLFVTSRSLGVIKDQFADLPSLSLEKECGSVSADIQLHVTREVDSDRRLRIASARLKGEIQYTLCKNADGMFRWVQCQLDTLKRCMTPMDIREALESLPKGLEETYQRILLAIDEEKREADVARRALTWLVAAFSPLRLSQIIEALSIDLNRRIMDPDLAPIHGPALLDALSSLVTHDEETDVVNLSHFSAQEYLTGEFTHARLFPYHINPPYAEGQLAQFCMCYIAACLKQGQRSNADVSSSHIIQGSSIDSDYIGPSRAVHGPFAESRPLLEYVLSHAFHHLALVNSGNKVVLRALVALEADVQRNPVSWDRVYGGKKSIAPPWPTSQDDLVIYILIAFATEPLLRSFLGRRPVKPKAGTNPLVYAAQLNKVAHARTLLSRGATLNQRGLLASDPRQVTPLEAAVLYGSFPIADLFLKRGSPLSQRIFGHILKSEYVKDEVHMRVIARLLQTDDFAEWAVEVQDGFRFSGFLGDLNYTDYEQKPDDEDIVSILRRLVQVGCDLSSCSSITPKLFHQATAAGYISTVKHMLSLNLTPPHDILLMPHAFTRRFLPSSLMMHLLISSGVDLKAVTANEGDNALHVLIGSTDSDISESNRLERVRLLVNAGCDPSTRNLNGVSPLSVAVGCGLISVVEYLLSLDIPRPHGILLTSWRTSSKKSSMIQYLICTGADVSVVADNGDTILHTILDCPPGGHQDTQQDCLESTKILINAGCNPRIANSAGETIIDVALQTGHASVVEYLLALNVPLPFNAMLRVSNITEFSLTSLQVTKMLVANMKGCVVGVVSPDGSNALHLALSRFVEEYLEETVKILFDAGCDASARNTAGQTPMHLAAKYEHKSIIAYFLSQGAQLPRDIMLVATTGELYTLLIEQGADPRVIAKDGDTVLHRMIGSVSPEHDALKLTKALIHAGCNPSLTNSAGETPLQVAARRGYVSIIQYLFSNHAPLPTDILFFASQHQSSPRNNSRRAQAIRYLVEKGAATNVVTGNSDTALHLALSCHFSKEDDALKIAKLLITAGCDPRTQNLDGETALHAAAKGGYLTSLEYLISEGVPFDPNILLAQATASFPNHKPTVMRFLISKGADIHAVTSKGDTPLHLTLACNFELVRLETARILVDSGCDPSQPNLVGETPLHVAASSGFPSLVTYLRSLNVPLPRDILLAAAAPSGRPLARFQTPRIVPMFRLLIREGANVNVTAPNGDTLLHIIIRRRVQLRSLSKTRGQSIIPWSLVGLLLRSGCDPFVRNADGQTPFNVVEDKGRFAHENFLRMVNTYCHVPDHYRHYLEASRSKRRAEDTNQDTTGRLTKRGRLEDIEDEDEDEIAEVDEQLMA